MWEEGLPEIEKEEDSSDPLDIPRGSIEEIKVTREEDRRDADSAHARNRDTLITIAGMILIFVLVCMYSNIIRTPPPDKEAMSLFLNLLDSVIMLIIGYIFGTKINRN
jgi:hypothetical protein